MADTTTRDRLKAEVEAAVTVVEKQTGLSSRWNGDVVVADSAIALLTARQPFMAKKEWTCRIVILDLIAEDDLRWRSLIHESLHSVSVGMNERDYHSFHGWEEGVVEALQRLYRPDILQQLGIVVPEAVFVEAEREWTYNRYINALERLALAIPGISEQAFLETLLETPLAERSAMTLSWGKRAANDSPTFVRTFAEVSGVLRR